MPLDVRRGPEKGSRADRYCLTIRPFTQMTSTKIQNRTPIGPSHARRNQLWKSTSICPSLAQVFQGEAQVSGSSGPRLVAFSVIYKYCERLTWFVTNLWRSLRWCRNCLVWANRDLRPYGFRVVDARPE